MRIVLFLFLLSLSLFASKILNYNVYDRSDRVDVMFTFDIPYSGKISQYKQGNKIVIKLFETTIDEAKIKKLDSNFLTKLTILPLNNDVQIIAKTPNNIEFKASQTSDKYGLRLRFTKVTTVLDKPAANQSAASNAEPYKLPTKEDYEISSQYMIVVGILLFLLIVLYYVKNRLPQTSSNTKKFKGLSFKNSLKDGVNIKFQKSIDATNKVVILEYSDFSYLVLMGSSNIVLDKFQGGEALSTQNDFNDLLKNKQSELDEYLQIDKIERETPSRSNEQLFFDTTKIDEAYNDYKEKASLI